MLQTEMGQLEGLSVRQDQNSDRTGTVVDWDHFDRNRNRITSLKKLSGLAGSTILAEFQPDLKNLNTQLTSHIHKYGSSVL